MERRNFLKGLGKALLGIGLLKDVELPTPMPQVIKPLIDDDMVVFHDGSVSTRFGTAISYRFVTGAAYGFGRNGDVFD